MENISIQEQFNLVSKEYDANRRKFIPCFDDFYISVTDFIAKSLDKKPQSIVDLGAGTGLLTSFFFRYFSDSEYVLADIASEMLDIAKKRFDNLPNIKYEICDYSEKFPKEKADLVISALSIHHLENGDKQNLFNSVYEHLENEGLFVNYDQFCAEDSLINDKIEKYWIDGIKSSGISKEEYDRWIERKKLDRECSVKKEISWLKKAGFSVAECVYSCGKFSVIIARK